MGGERELTAAFAASMDEVVARVRAGDLDAVAIDMPIGLLDTHPRPADVAARVGLGPRKSSVFPTPLRVTLEAETYAEACELSRAACGKALSKQAWFLLPKIRELDDLLTPPDQDRIVESHPERTFARLRGAPLANNKSTPEGHALRRSILADVFGAAETAHVGESRVAPATDLLDALALVTAAERVALGREIRHGNEIDATGLRAQIVD